MSAKSAELTDTHTLSLKKQQLMNASPLAISNRCQMYVPLNVAVLHRPSHYRYLMQVSYNKHEKCRERDDVSFLLTGIRSTLLHMIQGLLLLL